MIGLSSIVGVSAWQGLASPLAGVVVAIGAFGFSVFARQRGKGIERAVFLMSAGNLDAAEAELARLDRKRPRIEQWLLDSQMGTLLWLKGNLEGALERLARALPESKSTGRLTVAFYMATISTMLRKEIPSEVESIIENTPTTPMFRIMLGRLDLSRAFHLNSAEILPSEDELHELGKLVLTTNRFGDVLALLAWAACERGDEDMAAHWLREAKERLNQDLSSYMPELHVWMQQR